ncbi:MAG: hypothetical protein GY940_44845 [bacterium]|nr:hypothetical protein [bacterium]
MDKREAYEKKLVAIRGIAVNEIKQPHNIPVGVYFKESEELYHWCQEDKGRLTAVGLAWEMVSDLPLRCGALSEAEALWCVQRKGGREARRRWKREAPLAIALRKELAAAFRFAFRDRELLIRGVRETTKDQSYPAMVQSLNDLSGLGRAHPDLLEAIGFDMSLLEKAAETSRQMGRLYANVVGDRQEYSDAKKTRDQAYTHLYEAAEEIRKYGQFVFRNEPDRLIGYRSQYMRDKRKEQKQTKAKTIPQQPDKEMGQES